MQPCGRNDNREYDEVDEYAFPATKLSSRNSCNNLMQLMENSCVLEFLKYVLVCTFIRDTERTIVMIIASRSQ